MFTTNFLLLSVPQEQQSALSWWHTISQIPPLSSSLQLSYWSVVKPVKKMPQSDWTAGQYVFVVASTVSFSELPWYELLFHILVVVCDHIPPMPYESFKFKIAWRQNSRITQSHVKKNTFNLFLSHIYISNAWCPFEIKSPTVNEVMQRVSRSYISGLISEILLLEVEVVLI